MGPGLRLPSAMARSLRALCVGAGLAAVGHAAAQDIEAPQFEPPPSPLRCLAGGEAPSYPRRADAGRDDATVRVEMRFTAADRPPEVKVVFNSADDMFADAVREKVAAYRLPCLAAGQAPMLATQEFEFVARRTVGPVLYGPPREKGSPSTITPDFAKCMVGIQADQITYPRSALKGDQEGTVLLHMRFTAADLAPDVTIVYDAGSPSLGQAARNAALLLRLPCMDSSAGPVEADQGFSFRIDGNARSIFKEAVTLQQLLGLVVNPARQPVRFDFGRMACPFQLQFRLYQPYLPNSVGQVGAWNENRVEFVEWLKTLSLNLPAKLRPQLIGSKFTVDVPCGGLDLT